MFLLILAEFRDIAKCKVYSQVFASIKQIAFRESKLLVRNEKKTALMQVTYDLSTILLHCALKGAWDSWGINFCIYNRPSW